MEKFFIHFGAPLAVIFVGGILIWIVKMTLKGHILELQKVFVTKESCQQHKDQTAEERESLRKEDEKNDERITYLERNTVRT